jgi:hypothetical protein
MSHETRQRIRTALETPGARLSVDRVDLEVAVSTLEAVDDAIQAELTELRRQLEVKDAEYAVLLAAHLEAVSTRPEPAGR